MLRKHDYISAKCVDAHTTFCKAYSLLEAPFIFGTRLLSANLQRPKSGLSTKFGYAVLNNGIPLKATPSVVGFVLFLLACLFSFLECTENKPLGNSRKEAPHHSSLDKIG